MQTQELSAEDFEAQVRQVLNSIDPTKLHTMVLLIVDKDGEDCMHMLGNFNTATELLVGAASHMQGQKLLEDCPVSNKGH